MTTTVTAVQAVGEVLRSHVENCRIIAESGLGSESAYWADRGRHWSLLADGVDADLFVLLGMGVDIRALIAREVAMRAGEARLLAAIAALPDGGDFLNAEPVTALELVVDAQHAADIDAAGGDR
jgi:hypothetical protein